MYSLLQRLLFHCTCVWSDSWSSLWSTAVKWKTTSSHRTEPSWRVSGLLRMSIGGSRAFMNNAKLIDIEFDTGSYCGTEWAAWLPSSLLCWNYLCWAALPGAAFVSLLLTIAYEVKEFIFRFVIILIDVHSKPNQIQFFLFRKRVWCASYCMYNINQCQMC